VRGLLWGLVCCSLTDFLHQVVAQNSENIATDSRAEHLIERALAQHLDENPSWLKLGHYQARKLGRGYQSDAANAKFFIDPNGRENPRAELIATLRLGISGAVLPVAMPQAPAMTVRCQYPARWKFLQRELKNEYLDVPAMDCPAYDEFVKRTRPKSATFVFSGYYINNPSSIFGHVFLRLNKFSRPGQSAELLDYGVGYAANPTGANQFVDAFSGFAGFSQGSFSSVPYYFKVREYSDAESRDLWEYDLGLSAGEMEILTDHIWELGSTYFNYYYLTANCAYQLLYLLEVAAPRLHLLERMPFYEIPVDAVKAVAAEPGLVTRVHYRPSTQRILKERFARLNPDEQKIYLRIHQGPEPEKKIKDLAPEVQARVLDAVLDDLDYRYFNELMRKENDPIADRKRQILMVRAALPPGDDIIVPYSDADRPDQGHSSSRWSLGIGTQSDPSFNGSMVDAEIRFALHDISDPLQGYLPYSTVEFWRMRGRVFPALARFDLQSFSLVTVSSLAPMSALEKNFSWRFDLGAERIRDRRCDDCLAADLTVLYGASSAFFNDLLVYGLIGGVGEASALFNSDHWTPGLSSHVGFRFKPNTAGQILADGEWRRVFDREIFDRLSGSITGRVDFGKPEQSPFALEAILTTEVSSYDFLLRYLKYF